MGFSELTLQLGSLALGLCSGVFEVFEVIFGSFGPVKRGVQAHLQTRYFSPRASQLTSQRRDLSVGRRQFTHETRYVGVGRGQQALKAGRIGHAADLVRQPRHLGLGRPPDQP